MPHDFRSTRSLGEPDPPFTENEAREVLARAAEREHALSAGISAAHLREAAVEAGISAGAFDRAAADVRGREPAGRHRRWARAATAVLALALAVVAGSAAWQRAVSPPVPSATAPALPAGASPTGASPSGPNPEVAGACAAPGGVPAERLRTLAGQLYPEVVAQRNRHRFLVVGLLFDAECNLKAHVLTRRDATKGTVDAVLGPAFPAASRDHALQMSGIADVGPWTFEKGAPWVMWGMERPPR